VPSPPEEKEEAEEAALPMEEYQPSDLSEEETIQRAIEESELFELGQWVGLGSQLQASVPTSRAAPHHRHLLHRQRPSPRDADGALAVSLGPATAHQPHRGRQRQRQVGAAAQEALVLGLF
jgi:hypothetical protein